MNDENTESETYTTHPAVLEFMQSAGPVSQTEFVAKLKAMPYRDMDDEEKTRVRKVAEVRMRNEDFGWTQAKYH